MVKFADKKASGDKEIYVADSKGAAGVVQIERFEKGTLNHLFFILFF